jgi:hypothetical protein
MYKCDLAQGPMNPSSSQSQVQVHLLQVEGKFCKFFCKYTPPCCHFFNHQMDLNVNSALYLCHGPLTTTPIND